CTWQRGAQPALRLLRLNSREIIRSSTLRDARCARSIIEAHRGRLWADVNEPSKAPYFSSPCRARKRSSCILFRRLAALESLAKAAYQLLLVNRLPKVTNDPVAQDAGPDVVIGVGRHEDRRDRAPHPNEVAVELDSRHCRHMDVSDQAGDVGETRRCQEIGRRRESLDAVAQRPQEPFHGFAKELIILHDRNHWRVRHMNSSSSLAPVMRALDNLAAPARELRSLPQRGPSGQCRRPVNFGLAPQANP